MNADNTNNAIVQETTMQFQEDSKATTTTAADAELGSSPTTTTTITTTKQQEDQTSVSDPHYTDDPDDKAPSSSAPTTASSTTTTTSTQEQQDYHHPDDDRRPTRRRDEEEDEDAEYEHRRHRDDDGSDGDRGYDVEREGAGEKDEEEQPDFGVKHQLQNAWTLWYDIPAKKTPANWEANLQQVITFNTIEDFWSVFNHIKQPSCLGTGSTYHLFKEGIRPMWEDAANKGGGQWVIEIPKSDKGLDEWWLNTVMACIGETFEFGDDICGVVVSVRKDKNRLALWTKASRENVHIHIGKQFQEFGGFDYTGRLSFRAHEDSLKQPSASTYRNKKYRL